MKNILIFLLLFSSQSYADIYIKVGTGYKLIEMDNIITPSGKKIPINTGGKFSARIEIGAETGNWSYGLSHHSQWADGYPVNDRKEPQKTEIFIDYKWSL